VTPKQQAALEKLEKLGQSATGMLDNAAVVCDACGGGSDIFREREYQIIREMCDWFRTTGPGGEPHVALRLIAAVAEVRALRDALADRARQGGKAKAALYTPAT